MKGEEVDKHAWELALLHEARTALRAGDLIVEGSQRYAAWDNDLYQRDVWVTRRDAWYQEQDLPQDAATFLSTLLDQLHHQTLHVSRRIANRKNQDARVENEKLVLTPLEKIELPPRGSGRQDGPGEPVPFNRTPGSAHGGQSLDQLSPGFNPPDGSPPTFRWEPRGDPSCIICGAGRRGYQSGSLDDGELLWHPFTRAGIHL